MPRLKADLNGLMTEFKARLAAVIDAARVEGRTNALAQIQKAVGGRNISPKTRRPRKRKAKATKNKSGKKRKNPWAGLSPEMKLARVNAIRKGRGLEPKDNL